MPRDDFCVPGQRLLPTGLLPNIYESIQIMFPLLAGRAPPLEETLAWLKFVYTTDRTGAYVAPSSAVLDQSVVSEGDPLLTVFWRHILLGYPGD